MAAKAKQTRKPAGKARAAAKAKASPKAVISVKAKAPRPLGERAQIEADALAGKLPPAPDLSADTHKRFRPMLAEVVALVKAGDVKALKATKIPDYSSSPRAIERYRKLAVTALESRK